MLFLKAYLVKIQFRRKGIKIVRWTQQVALDEQYPPQQTPPNVT